MILIIKQYLIKFKKFRKYIFFRYLFQLLCIYHPRAKKD